MILLLGSLTPPLMLYARGVGRELSCYKLTNYLIADHAFAIALQEGKMGLFLKSLLKIFQEGFAWINESGYPYGKM